MQDADFPTFMARALDIVAAEAPEAYEAMTSRLEGVRLGLNPDGTALAIWVKNGWVEIFPTAKEVDLTVGFSSSVILDLIDGRRSLEKSIYDDRLFLKGTIEMVERFHDGLMLFLQGAVRCPGMPRLLARFRTRHDDGPPLASSA